MRILILETTKNTKSTKKQSIVHHQSQGRCTKNVPTKRTFPLALSARTGDNTTRRSTADETATNECQAGLVLCRRLRRDCSGRENAMYPAEMNLVLPDFPDLLLVRGFFLAVIGRPAGHN
jgi:hypothetical protein